MSSPAGKPSSRRALGLLSWVPIVRRDLCHARVPWVSPKLGFSYELEDHVWVRLPLEEASSFSSRASNSSSFWKARMSSTGSRAGRPRYLEEPPPPSSSRRWPCSRIPSSDLSLWVCCLRFRAGRHLVRLLVFGSQKQSSMFQGRGGGSIRGHGWGPRLELEWRSRPDDRPGRDHRVSGPSDVAPQRFPGCRGISAHFYGRLEHRLFLSSSHRA